LLKILHPVGNPTDEEFEQYVAYAVECRQRVKEQMNKRKPDDEFARINLSYFTTSGEEIIVFCPESKGAAATQHPERKYQGRRAGLADAQIVDPPTQEAAVIRAPESPNTAGSPQGPAKPPEPELREQHFTVLYNATGYTYESIIGPYLRGVREAVVEDTYIRLTHQIQNFARLCETLVKAGTVKRVVLITKFDADTDVASVVAKLEELKDSLSEVDVELDVQINPNLHDREIQLDNSWVIKIGRGLDFYQKPDSYFEIGVYDFSLRKCLETKVDIYRSQPSTGSRGGK